MLHLAISKEYKTLIPLILSRDLFELSIVKNQANKTPLDIAYENKNYEIIKLFCHAKKSHLLGGVIPVILKDNNLNPDQKYDLLYYFLHEGVPTNFHDGGNTPLHIAVTMKDTNLVSLLISFNASLSARNNTYHTPASLAANEGFFEIATLFPRFKKTDEKDSYNYSVCLRALILDKNINQNDQFDYVQLFLRAGAQVNYGPHSDTALHKSVQAKNKNLAALLLVYGANDTLPNQNNQRPRQIDPQCFIEAWALKEQTLNLKALLIALYQGSQQGLKTFELIFYSDVSQKILQFAEKLPDFMIYKNIFFTTRVRAFVNDYNNRLFKWSSAKSKEFVAEMDRAKHYPKLVDKLVKEFVLGTSAQGMTKPPKAFELLIKHGFFSQRIEEEHQIIKMNRLAMNEFSKEPIIPTKK